MTLRSQIREQWEQGRRAVNCWMLGPSLMSAEVVGTLGFDSILLDLQHGGLDGAQAYAMLLALSTSSATPLVRVPDDDPATIMRMLDAGAQGIVCPMIDTAAAAEAFVQACRYPPRGSRSYGLTRTGWVHGRDEYFDRIDDLVVTIAQIESPPAVENLDAILATPGLDAILIGPVDLGLALTGELPKGLGEPPLAGRLEPIVAAARRGGVRVAMPPHAPADAALLREWDVDMVSIGSDVTLLATAARQRLEEAREL